MYNKDNIFAKIIRKEIPCNTIYEDEMVMFFNDLYPQARIHILGIPKIDVTDFSDFIEKGSLNIVNHFFSKVYDVINISGIKQSGYKIITNSGKDANQEVPHFHIHILGGEKLKNI
jgi:diadenosine tetraphosphate (Ap4A) HIT family hydrolase|tara:strand:+ start:591 stop:938 length:348 start_codon:yes stop_codon:yes gene_type:complete